MFVLRNLSRQNPDIRFELINDTSTAFIGRDPSHSTFSEERGDKLIFLPCDLSAEFQPPVSRLHFMVQTKDGVLYLTNLSTIGTFVNGKRLTLNETVKLQHSNKRRACDKVCLQRSPNKNEQQIPLKGSHWEYEFDRESNRELLLAVLRPLFNLKYETQKHEIAKECLKQESEREEKMREETKEKNDYLEEWKSNNDVKGEMYHPCILKKVMRKRIYKPQCCRCMHLFQRDCNLRPCPNPLIWGDWNKKSTSQSPAAQSIIVCEVQNTLGTYNTPVYLTSKMIKEYEADDTYEFQVSALNKPVAYLPNDNHTQTVTGLSKHSLTTMPKEQRFLEFPKIKVEECLKTAFTMDHHPPSTNCAKRLLKSLTQEELDSLIEKSGYELQEQTEYDNDLLNAMKCIARDLLHDQNKVLQQEQIQLELQKELKDQESTNASHVVLSQESEKQVEEPKKRKRDNLTSEMNVQMETQPPNNYEITLTCDTNHRFLGIGKAQQGKSVKFIMGENKSMKLGRQPEKDSVVISDHVKHGMVSRSHAVFRLKDDNLIYKQLVTATNGSKVDKTGLKPLTESERTITTGTIITLGGNGPSKEKSPYVVKVEFAPCTSRKRKRT